MPDTTYENCKKCNIIELNAKLKLLEDQSNRREEQTMKLMTDMAVVQNTIDNIEKGISEIKDGIKAIQKKENENSISKGTFAYVVVFLILTGLVSGWVAKTLGGG